MIPNAGRREHPLQEVVAAVRAHLVRPGWAQAAPPQDPSGEGGGCGSAPDGWQAAPDGPRHDPALQQQGPRVEFQLVA